MNIHEILFTRGDVQNMDEEVRLQIHVPANCGWVHQEPCHKVAEGKKGTERALQYLIRYEGMTQIEAFLLRMGEVGVEFDTLMIKQGLIELAFLDLYRHDPASV